MTTGTSYSNKSVLRGDSFPFRRRCHYHELFVNSGGDIYPCCISWNDPGMRIAHVDDPDIMERLAAFDARCACSSFVMDTTLPGVPADYKLNVEFSLDCNAACAMCCVDAPHRRGPYAHYDGIDRLMETLPSISHLVAQGGEVLVQKDTMRWLARAKVARPEMPMALITNGNVAAEMAAEVGELFFNVLISIYGFQDATYRAVTGLPLQRTRRFAEELSRRGNTTVHLKFLVTPLNLHEAALFLRWAAGIGPSTVSFIDAATESYLRRDTKDRFWDTVIARSGSALRDALAAAREGLAASGTVVLVDAFTRAMFGLDDDFIAARGLTGIVLPNPMVG